MTPPLFLLEKIPATGDDLLLAGDEGHHAARVVRVGVGEQVLISDGAGVLLRCTVQRVSGGDVHLRIDERTRAPEPTPRLVAVQALPKGERAELAVEMMTELGVDEIVPWEASRSVTRWAGARGDKALARWRRTARTAAKQCRRPRIPTVADLASTKDVCRLLSGGTGLVLHEDAPARLASAALPADADVVLVIGPEGGVAPDELDAFAAAGAVPVLLGESVLRTSTAGAAALAVLSLRLGRWG